MPRFDNEQELLEKLRDDAGKMKLWAEYTPKGLENTRYEIINGMIVLKPRYRMESSIITGNLIGLYLKASDEYLLLTYFDVKIDDNNLYLPKAIIEKRYPVYLGSNKIYSTEPIVVFELFVKDNYHILNAKFKNYQKLETLQEYVVIDLYSPRIWVYRKDNDWRKETFDAEQSFSLNSIDYTVKVSDIYYNIDFNWFKNNI